MEASRSDLDPLVVPAEVAAVFVVVLAVLSRFVISSLVDFWLAFLEGGSSLIIVVIVFLFFLLLPESPIKVAGRLLNFGVEEVPLVSPFSTLLVTVLEFAAAEAAMRCLIRADDG